MSTKAKTTPAKVTPDQTTSDAVYFGKMIDEGRINTARTLMLWDIELGSWDEASAVLALETAMALIRRHCPRTKYVDLAWEQVAKVQFVLNRGVRE